MIVKFRAKALATFFPAALKTTTASAHAAAAVKDGDRLLASAATVRGARGMSDVGALKESQPGTATHNLNCPDECPEGSVGYCRGTLLSNSLKCNEECCVGEDACKDFTGCVKKDGSCTGPEACAEAVANEGIENSCIGVNACTKLGGHDGVVGKLINSCNDDSACNHLGYFVVVAGDVTDSCNGNMACDSLGRKYGIVGNIQDSCNSDNACEGLGRFHGVVGNVQDSCNGVKACKHLGYYGVVDNLSNSCNAEEACYALAYSEKVDPPDAPEDRSVIGDISNSCIAKSACTYLGSDSGKVGNIANSCNTEEACHSLVRHGGSIKSITGSCNSNKKQQCRQLFGSQASNQDIGNISPFKRKWRMGKYRTADISVCQEDCDKAADCSGIKWRQGVTKPCRIFKGAFSGKCGERDLCIDQ